MGGHSSGMALRSSIPGVFFAARTLHQGFLPLWNPYQFCGTPFVANSQSAVFYPLNLLFVLMPVQAAFGASAWLHLVLTGWLMYGFLRSPTFGLGRSAATLGAVAWQLSTWQASWLALPTFLCVSAWLPLALWLTDRPRRSSDGPARGGLGHLSWCDASGRPPSDRSLLSLVDCGLRYFPCDPPHAA